MGESFFESKQTQTFLTLLSICMVGVVLRGRFPGKEPSVVQKVLLQVFVPATLFRGLSKERIDWGHSLYLGSGILYLALKICTAVLISYATFGRSRRGQLATFRRTAIFQIGTTASAQSVLPYLEEFIDQRFVGLGGMVDLPMKLYMLAIMPFILKACGESPLPWESVPSSQAKEKQLMKAFVQFITDPITVALVLGILTAVLTQGGGVKALGFAGNAISSLAGAQGPMLFFLIGLKLKFKSATPIICMVLLLANYGIMLILMAVIFQIVEPDADTQQSMVFFAQGAPSVVGMGVIASAVASGVQGFSAEFSFDIVGISFPMTAMLQCSAGLFGASWRDHLVTIGCVLIAASALLRLCFNNLFEDTLPREPATLPPNDPSILNREQEVAFGRDVQMQQQTR